MTTSAALALIALLVIAIAYALRVAKAALGAKTQTPRENVPDGVWHPKGWIK